MHTKTLSILAVSASLLSACGGSSSGAFAGLSDDLDDRVARLTGPAADQTIAEEFPSGGLASYAGEIAFITSDLSTTQANVEDSDTGRANYIGRVAIDVNFDGTPTLAGGGSDFVNRNGDAVAGAVAITQGEITPDAAGTAWEASMNGELDGLEIDGDLNGVFVGTGATGLVGVGLPTDEDDDPFLAYVAAEK